MHSEPFPKIKSAALQDFAETAREFCRTIEDRANLEAVGLLGAVHLLLAKLYLAALSLPSADVLSSEEQVDPVRHPANPDRVTHDEWRELFASLQELIGAQDSYREVFDPYKPISEGEVTGSIADDLADIYRDLKVGLAAWDRGQSGDALWTWRFGFESHWGEHATGALRALHVMCSTYGHKWPSGGATRFIEEG